MAKLAQPTTINTTVLPTAFREALQADLSSHGIPDDLERRVSPRGMAPRPGSANASSPWMTLHDAVTVLTRQMRFHGHYPETVLVAIKTAVCEAAIPLVAEDIVAHVVQYAAQVCITAYFEDSEPRQVAAIARPVAVPAGVETPRAIRPSTSLEHRP